MARLPTCSGAAIFTRKLYAALSYPAVQAATGLTDTLPTSEPATPQLSYTLAASDAPTVTANFDLAFTLHPLIWARGRNTGGASRTISYRLKKNGASVATGTLGSCANNYYYCVTAGYKWGDTPPVVGDVIELALWSNGAGVSLTDTGMGCSASRFMKNRDPLTLLYLTAFQETAGTFKPSWASTYAKNGYHLNVVRTNHTGLPVDLDSVSSFQSVVGRAGFGCIRIQYGDTEVYTYAEMNTLSSSGAVAGSPRRIYQLRAVELVVPSSIGIYTL